MFGCIGSSLLLPDLALVPEIHLIADEEYNNVAVGLLLQGLQPLRDVLEAIHARDVVDQEGAHRTPIVG